MEHSKARRRRVPAFGEWNYYYYSGELATPTAASEPQWHAPAAAELEASSDVWFKYSPPPRKPPPQRSAGRKKASRRPEKTDDRSAYGGGGKRGVHHRCSETPARASSSDGVEPSAAARTPASKGKVVAAASGAGVRRVVRPVDADLYQVPPPEFVPDYDDEPRRWHKEVKRKKKKASRSRWMGCFGFNCVPAE
ncbi:unnamed protein product [Urochloa humidicola]